MSVITFTVKGCPMGKPRMTRRDKWAKRDCVMRYRQWADIVRMQAPELTADPLSLWVVAYFPFPEGYSQKKRELLKGKPHRVKPDSDNCLKSVSDILFKNDSCISDMRCVKRWEDGSGARVEVTVL